VVGLGKIKKRSLIQRFKNCVPRAQLFNTDTWAPPLPHQPYIYFEYHFSVTQFFEFQILIPIILITNNTMNKVYTKL
jgi:hypothetical protein